MNRKNGIDLIRFIGAFFIMCLHTTYGDLNQEFVDNIRLLSRWAVPFFFITTGYFFGNKIKNDTLDFKEIQNNISYLISIFIVSSIIYLPFSFKVTGTIKLTIENIITGTYFHLWFMGSLLVGYLFIWYMYFTNKNKLLPYISIGILLIALLSDSYDKFIHVNLGYSLFRFLLSIPFIYLGIIISKNEFSFINNKLLIGLVLIGIAIQIIEAEMFLRLFNYKKFNHQLLIGTIIMVIPLFIYSSRINLKENVFSEWGRKYSLFIYLYHPIAYFIIGLILHNTIPTYTDSVNALSPIIGFTFILTFVILLNKFFPKIYNIMNGSI